MIQIAIVEDDAGYRAQFQSYLRRFGKENGVTFKITEFTDGAEIAEDYGRNFDIILMDIEMHFMNGMKAAQEIRAVDSDVTIIFITNMPQYAIEGYKVAALDYILKPVSYFAFAESVRRAIRSRRKQGEFIIVSVRGKGQRLFADRIRYVDVLNHDLCYHTLDGDITVRDTMRHAIEQLPEDQFFQCNKAYLINLAFVDGINGNDVVLGEDALQISRSKRKALLDALNNYLAVTGR